MRGIDVIRFPQELTTMAVGYIGLGYVAYYMGKTFLPLGFKALKNSRALQIQWGTVLVSYMVADAILDEKDSYVNREFFALAMGVLANKLYSKSPLWPIIQKTVKSSVLAMATFGGLFAPFAIAGVLRLASAHNEAKKKENSAKDA